VKISIIGLSNSGKSTVFNTLTRSDVETGSFTTAKAAPNIAVVRVPDKRVDILSDIFLPKKKTPAEITFQDFVGIVKDNTKKKDTMFSEEVKQSEALVHVCRVFNNDTVPHPDGTVGPVRDAEILELELIMSDLALVDNKIDRITKELTRKKTTEMLLEKELMERLKTILESEKPIRSVELTEEEKKILKGYCFLSQKPMILLANLSEDQIENPPTQILKEFAANARIEFMEFCGKLEMEISQMEPEEQQEFLKEYGIDEPARDTFIRKTYNMLGLISFFTVGEDEVKAWTITRGTEAVNAAGEIHTDLQRGFIRAETVSYDDFMTVKALSKARDKGLLRQEGKSYTVQDGDIINIKFNV
jgi:hypothetical protein